MSLIVPNASDTTGGNKYAALDQAEPDSLDLEILSLGGSGVLTGCEVTTNTSAVNVAVSAGTIVLNGAPYAVSAAAALTLPAAPADNRFDIVVARVTSGTVALAVVSGANDATNPSFPKSASVITGAPSLSTNVNLATDVVLASLYRSGAGTVTTSRIADKRRMVSISVFDQGSDTPSTGYGVKGGLFLKVGAPNGSGSNLYLKNTNDIWIELAQNVGAQMPIGGAFVWPGNGALPSGCLEADGSLYSTSLYPALFAIYGYLYGGSGGTFGVPNYNDKYLRGTTSTGLVGTNVGNDSLTLATANLPAHTHSMAHTHSFAHTHGINHSHGGGGSLTTSSGGSHSHAVTGTTNSTGTHDHQLASGFGVLAQVFASAQPYLRTTTTPTGTEVIWSSAYTSTGTSGAHSHTVTATSDTVAAHTHTVTVADYSGSTTSQSTSTTGAASASDTGSAGSGTAISLLPASTYVRWVIRASLGTDPNYTGGGAPLTYTTGTRPSAVTSGDGFMIYDSTLDKPIWSNGTVWKDATGTAV